MRHLKCPACVEVFIKEMSCSIMDVLGEVDD
jgi:hypothetical protein